MGLLGCPFGFSVQSTPVQRHLNACDLFELPGKLPQAGLGLLRGPGRAGMHSAVGGGLTRLILLPGGRGYEADARKEECWKSHPGS